MRADSLGLMWPRIFGIRSLSPWLITPEICEVLIIVFVFGIFLLIVSLIHFFGSFLLNDFGNYIVEKLHRFLESTHDSKFLFLFYAFVGFWINFSKNTNRDSN